LDLESEPSAADPAARIGRSAPNVSRWRMPSRSPPWPPVPWVALLTAGRRCWLLVLLRSPARSLRWHSWWPP